MIRNWIRNISLPVWLVMTVLAGCIDETGLGNLQSENASEGNISLSFSVNVPDMTEVVTRSVDEDATGVETIRLFCFDNNGLFITTATTSSHTQGEPNEDGYYLEGTFTAEVPNYTHIVHLVANQNLDNFNETEWLGKSEAEVMTTLTATSNRMIYWGRVEPNEGETIAAAMQRVSDDGGGIVMIRDQAKVTVTVNTDAGFTLTAGYFVCNTNAFGTIAPYNRTTNAFDWRTAVPKYITLPTETARATTPQDVSNQEAQYVFETQNDLSDPVSVIIKGQNDSEEEKYYRVLILDNTTEEPMPILRNHHYQIQVTGKLSYGYDTFAEALKGAATNNIWISIADEINTVSDGTKTLSVNETYVVTEGQENASIPYILAYTYTENGMGVTEAPVVSWVTGENNVAQSTISTNYDPETGAGTIQISLLPMEGNSKREGTLLVKKGKLQRTIKIITVKKMTFTPAWVSTGIYSNASNQHVTMMFNIPEDCPDELLPIRVLISIDHMDVRNASGMQLSVITKTSNPDEYGEDNGIGYKYVYEVAEKGTQRVYFETVLSDDAPDNVVFEAPFFETLSKTFTYSNVQKAISLEGLSEYTGGNIEDDGFAEDDVIYYKLVPQKINAFVDFTIGIDNNGTPENIGVNDEFLLYSQYLSAYDDNDFPINSDATQPQCTFVAVDESQWSTSGRVFGFYPREGYGGSDTQKTIYMHTNRPNSAEVVRIASNQNGSVSIKSSEIYNGGVYRSIVFELANYNPFTFNSSIKGSNNKEQQWTYEYGQQVDVKFDITSFTGSDGKQVDPFGTAFNVYIDAPMLEIDESRRPQGINETKFYQGADGRFVYVVDKDETTESNFFNGTVKTLPFKTSKIVSAGEITISADEDVVIFDSETYTITNQLITGTIQYGNTPLNVPANAFVAFERTRDGTRIGRVNVLSDGTYELLLRGEYSYAWSGDENIAMYYLAEDGNEYVAQFDNLATLFANPNIILK